jgi:prepilin-type N-terminal cleavage/methylation domain-containing protein
MKFISHIPSLQTPVCGKAIRAFALPELMTAMAIFSLVIAGTLSSQIFGLRMYRISEAKLTVASDGRRVLNTVRNEIWSGKLLYVGNGDDSSFKLMADNTPHIGNALRICATTDTNSYVHYFLDASDSCLKRTVSSNSQVQVIARNITNELVFQAEDFQGNVVANYQNNRVIKMTLQMHKPEWANALSEYYQLQTRVARRATE